MAVTITNRVYSTPYRMTADAAVTSTGGTFYCNFRMEAFTATPTISVELSDKNPVCRVSGGVGVLEQAINSQSYMIVAYGKE